MDENNGNGDGGGQGQAVRKIIGTLIEAHGGNGQLVKKDIETTQRGVLLCKDERVAAWEVIGGERRMKLMGEMA